MVRNGLVLEKIISMQAYSVTDIGKKNRKKKKMKYGRGIIKSIISHYLSSKKKKKKRKRKKKRVHNLIHRV